ncbi:MAG: hypothetical protein K0Q90_465 [Paenibacillaceae bacterium]|jgi:hypothetical protein|nr:hypothetical protein [Paenibacillaceae bacterium]
MTTLSYWTFWKKAQRRLSVLTAGVMAASAVLGLVPGMAPASTAAAASAAVQLQADYGAPAGKLIRTEQFNNTNYSPLPVHVVDELKGIGTKVVRDFVKINWYYNKDANNPERYAYSIDTPENLATNPDILSGRKETYDFMSQFTDSILISLAYSYGGDSNPGKNRLLTGETEMNWPEYDKAMKTIIRTLKEKNPKLEYIEVGNEPNLEPAFYGHTVGDIPGYMRMYKGMSEAVLWVNQQLGLNDTFGANGVRLKVGGPVLSGYDFAKQKEFVDLAYQNSYHVDFLSWHRYKTEISQNETQAVEMKAYLKRFFPEATTIVSEYGWKGGGGLSDSTGNVALAKQAAFMTDSAYYYERGGVDIPMNWVAVHTLNAYFKNQFDVDYALSNGTTEWQEYASQSAHPVQFLNLRGWRESATSSLMKIKEVELFDAAGQKIAIPNPLNDPNLAAVTDGKDDTFFFQNDYWAWLKFDLGQPQAVSKIRIKWGNTEINKFQIVGTDDRLHYYELLGKTFFTPYFNTMRMFSRLGDDKVAVTGNDGGNTGVRMIATQNSDAKATLMVWNHQLDGIASKDVHIQVSNLPAGFQGKSIRYSKYLVDATHSNYAYNKTDAMEVVEQGTMNVTGNDVFVQTLDPNAVMLIELEAVDPSINHVVSAGKTASGTLSNPGALLDGDAATAASAADAGYPQTAVIDLGKPFYLTGAEIKWTHAFSKGYRYSIAASLDGADYTTVTDRTYGEYRKGNALEWFTANPQARYVKLTVTGSDLGGPVSIDDLNVFADALYKNGFETAAEQNTSAWNKAGYSSTTTKWITGTVTGNTYIRPEATLSASPNFAVFGDAAWKDYSVEAKVKLGDPAYTGRVEMGLLSRALDRNNQFHFRVERGTDGSSKAILSRLDDGGTTDAEKNVQLAVYSSLNLDYSQWHTLRIDNVGSHITCYVDGVKVIETEGYLASDNPAVHRTEGGIGLRSRYAIVQYDDIKAAPILPVLGDIQVNGQSIPGFASGTYSYLVKLPSTGNDTAVVTASVYGGANGMAVPANSGPVSFGSEKTVTVAAMSTEGNGGTFYTVKLRKASGDATLSTLKLSVVPDSGPYNPAVLPLGDILLVPGQYEYNVKVPSRTRYVSVTEAVPTASNLAVTEVANAVLANGAGTLTVKVTAEAGNSNTYVLHLTANPEPASGNALYGEDFEQGDYNKDSVLGWKAAGTADAAAHFRVVDDGNGKVLEKFTTENKAFTVGAPAADYEVRARVKPVGSTALPGVIARASNDGQNFYMLRIHNGENGLSGGSTGYITLGRVVNGSLKEIAEKAPYPFVPGKWYQLRLVVSGNRLMGYVDDKLVFDKTDNGTLFSGNPAPLTSGKAGLRIANQVARIDDFAVSEITALPEQDTVKPVITLNGEAAVSIPAGSVYADPGATAADDVDGDLTAAVVVTGEVDTAVPGVYTIRYNVRDAAVNQAAEVIRSVTVFGTVSQGKSFVVNGGLLADRIRGLTAQVTVIPVAGAPAHDGDEVVYFQLLKDNAAVSYVAVRSDIAKLTSFAAHFDVPDPENPAYTIRVLVVDELFPVGGALPKALSDKVVLD